MASIKLEDQFTSWRSEYEADGMVSLASLVGERQFFQGDSSSGVSGDLESAAQIATLMEGYWGMGQSITSHGVTQKVGISGGGRPGEKEKDLLGGDLGERIEANLNDIAAKVETLPPTVAKCWPWPTHSSRARRSRATTSRPGPQLRFSIRGARKRAASTRRVVEGNGWTTTLPTPSTSMQSMTPGWL